MAANYIDTFVLIVPNLEWSSDESDLERLNKSISFEQDLESGIRTLSNHAAPTEGTEQGFPYVPDLASSDPCYSTSEEYVPGNVTRRANLPDTDYYLVAFAPWISASCTLSYLAAADQDPARAFIFYLPNSTSSGDPPAVTDPIWDLNDGGKWKTESKFPVYAISSEAGHTMMFELAQYSGNMTDVPYGNELTEVYDSRDYARMYTVIGIGSSTVTPGLWTFIVVVIAILLIIILGTSMTMHWIQYRRRRDLQRRVVNGEVDLEALGITRLTVPQDVIDRMALVPYDPENDKINHPSGQIEPPEGSPDVSSHPESHTPEMKGNAGTSMSLDGNQEIETALNGTPRTQTRKSRENLPDGRFAYQQPTCPICLDDFVPQETIVRSLPCEHIFHSECVDTFLKRRSSLCPICKNSVLPRGYCPKKITNFMVMKERRLRRTGERVTWDTPQERTPSFRLQWMGRRVQRPTPTMTRPGSMVQQSGLMSSVDEEDGRNVQSRIPSDRAVWDRPESDRESNNEIHEETDTLANEEMAIPKWKRALMTVFPVFR